MAGRGPSGAPAGWAPSGDPWLELPRRSMPASRLPPDVVPEVYFSRQSVPAVRCARAVPLVGGDDFGINMPRATATARPLRTTQPRSVALPPSPAAAKPPLPRMASIVASGLQSPPRHMSMSSPTHYEVTSDDVALAEAHGEFSTGWRRQFGSGRQPCPCGCGMSGGVRVHWKAASRRLLLEDGAHFAVYFELLCRCMMLLGLLGLLMLPIWVQRLSRCDRPSTDNGLQDLLGSARLLVQCTSSGSNSHLYLVEAVALLNTGVLYAVFVGLPRLRLDLREMVAHSMACAGEQRSRTRTWRNMLPSYHDQPDLCRAVLLRHVPPTATEKEVSEYLQEVLSHKLNGGQQERRSRRPAEEGREGPLVLLAPQDGSLAARLQKYAELSSLAAPEGPESPGQGSEPGEWAGQSPMQVDSSNMDMAPTGSWVRAELRNAAKALREPPSSKVWNMMTAPTGIAVFKSAKEALLLAEALAPGTPLSVVQGLHHPEAHLARLHRQMRSLRVDYPAPEPADVMWGNLPFQDNVVGRRFRVVLLGMLYLGVSFSLQLSIKSRVSNITVGVVNALLALALRVVFHKLIGNIAKPCAQTYFNASVAFLTIGGSIVSSAAVPFVNLAVEGQWASYSTWYDDDGISEVGATLLVLTAFACWFFDIAGTASLWFLTRVLPRPGMRWLSCCFCCCLPSIKSFRDLSKLYEGPDFELGQNVGYACFMVVMGFSGAAVQPAAPFVIMLGLLFWFHKEKWVLLQLCRRPVVTSAYVALQAPMFLAYTLALVPVPAVLGLLPLVAKSGDGAVETRDNLLRMGFNTCVVANFAVHGWFIAQHFFQRFSCVSHYPRRFRSCLRSVDRAGFIAVRVILWILVSALIYLEAFWHVGLVKGDEVDIGISKVSLVKASIQKKVAQGFDMTVMVLLGICVLGLLCRLVWGSQEVTMTLDDYEEGWEQPSTTDQRSALVEYVKLSPYHAVLAFDGEASPSLEQLDGWLDQV